MALTKCTGLMKNKVIAAVRTHEELMEAAQSDVKIVFDLAPDILTLEESVNTLHRTGKKFFIHLDLADGIGKDRSGIAYAKNAGVDGIISTRSGIIKVARELEVFTVQRFFIVDSHSIGTTVDALKSSKAHMIEIMPGSVTKVIKRLKANIEVPIIAGGLIETESEALLALKSGASAVSTGAKELWYDKER